MYYQKKLEVTYLVNSGTEAIEGAIKLAKRVTGRAELIAADNAYHGSTHGALSLIGAEQQKKSISSFVAWHKIHKIQ